MRKLILLFAAACLLTACDKDKDADIIAQYFFGKDSKTQVTPQEPDVPNNGRDATLQKAGYALQKVSDIYMGCTSIPDLKKHTDEISKIDDIEDVYFSSIAMFVKVKDFMTVSFSFYPKFEVPQLEQLDIPQIRQVRTRANTDYPINPLGYKKAVIIDNQTQDRDWGKYKDALKEVLDKAGIKTDIINSPTIEYMQDGLFDNDIVLIISHGQYDSETKLHWLITEDIYDSSQYDEINFWQYWLDSLPFVEFHNHYKGFIEDEQVRLDVRKTEDGKSTISILLSEKFFSSILKNFKRKALVFNVACQSLMKGNNSLKDNDQHDFAFAKAFIDRGAGVYFGYDEINGAGQRAGMLLLSSIASGQSVKSAFNSLPDTYVHNKLTDEEQKYYSHPWQADLFFYPENNFDIENSCHVFPVLEEKDENDESIILKLSEPYNILIYNYDSNNHIVTDVKMFEYEPNSSWDGFERYIFTYGFEVSTTKDFAPSLTKDYEAVFRKPYPDHFTLSSNGYYNELHLSYPVPKSDLEPDTKYFYRAYMKDATNTYYSDYKDFTFQGRIEQVVPDSIRDKMGPYITIYEGNNPPSVEGVFLFDPAEVVYDTTNNYEKGEQGFTPIYMRFSNQNVNQNTLDYEERDVTKDGKISNESTGKGAFISGEGNNFSVFFSTKGVSHRDGFDVNYRTSLVISGTKTDSGIKDIRYAFVMVDKQNDQKSELMNIGEFRVFKDGDGLAKNSSWPSGTRSWGRGYTVKDGKITTPWSIYSIMK